MVDDLLSTNQLFTDGVTEPSEFTENPFVLADMVDGWYLPDCEGCMACNWCADSGNCDAAAQVPNDFAGHD